MARLFLAITLPDNLKKQLFSLAQGLKYCRGVKIVEEENIHITLKFLGEAEPAEVTRMLDGIKLGAFEVSLSGIGAFPNAKNPRVIWAGCQAGSKDIVTLHNAMEKRLSAFEKDKNFHPHATIARVKLPKDKKSISDFVSANATKEIGAFKARSFELMESKLSRNGPKYSVIRSVVL